MSSSSLDSFLPPHLLPLQTLPQNSLLSIYGKLRLHSPHILPSPLPPPPFHPPPIHSPPFPLLPSLSRCRLQSRQISPIISSKSSATSFRSLSPPLFCPPHGAKPLPLILSLTVGLVICFFVPVLAALTPQSWSILSIFLSTIIGLVLPPLPIQAFFGLIVTVLTKTLSFFVTFFAFTNEVIWLIFISFFFAQGFAKTGLGDRVATYFMKWLGNNIFRGEAEAEEAPSLDDDAETAGLRQEGDGGSEFVAGRDGMKAEVMEVVEIVRKVEKMVAQGINMGIEFNR